MSKFKSIPKFGWFVVGVAVTALVVPTSVAAAGGVLKFVGIEGANANKADVTAAQQLLTTEAPPPSYQEYFHGVLATAGGTDCENIGSAIPSGQALVVKQVQVTVTGADGTSAYPTGTTSDSEIFLHADSPSGPTSGCGEGVQFAAAVAPAGLVGNVTIPLPPGYVIPSGYTISAFAQGMEATVWVTGYLVPSADAPALPQ